MEAQLNRAPCGFLSFADDRTILQVNATLARWLGYEPTDLIGQAVESILSVGGRIFCHTHIFPLLKLKGEVEEIYLSLQTRGHEALAVLTSASRHEAAGAFIYDCVFLPMRQRRQYEDELLQARKTADEASQAKARFLSMMSHELRTPLNAILGFGQLLEMDAPEERQRGKISHILKGGKLLLGLINEVLDMARIESGKMELTLEVIPVALVCHAATELIRPLADQRNVRVEACGGGACEGRMWADHQRLNQVVLNLLSNAVKYNRPGGTVTLRCEPSPTEPGRLRLSVRDTGWGISPENLEKLFTPFERLGAEQSNVEGTGIGLALCKGLVEAMGGAIGVSSIPGEGSTFYLELPSIVTADPNVSEASHEPEPDASVAGSFTVLYIEDNSSNFALVEQALEAKRPDIRLLGTMQGQLGIEMAREHRPDLILLDMHLPDVPGDSLFRLLQSDAVTRDIPVIMVSADATKEQVRKLLDLGVHSYLTKPLDIPLFLRTINEALADRPPVLIGTELP